MQGYVANLAWGQQLPTELRVPDCGVRFRMRYYKYVSDPNALASILAGEMRFTAPSELNDPSELFPRFSREEILQSLEDLRTRGHTNDELAGLQRQHALMSTLIPLYWKSELPLTSTDADLMIQLPFFDNIELVELLFLGMLQSMSNAVAIACLSKRWDCLPMWAHYANRARGVVVAYENLETPFPGDKTGWLNCPKEVTYTRETAGISFYPDSYGAIFFSKLRDWAYEYEIRIATELSNCTTVQRDGTNFHSRSIPARHVTSVIFGWRMPGAEVAKVLKLLSNDSYNHIQTEVAQVHRGSLSLQPLDRKRLMNGF